MSSRQNSVNCNKMLPLSWRPPLPHSHTTSTVPSWSFQQEALGVVWLPMHPGIPPIFSWMSFKVIFIVLSQHLYLTHSALNLKYICLQKHVVSCTFSVFPLLGFFLPSIACIVPMRSGGCKWSNRARSCWKVLGLNNELRLTNSTPAYQLKKCTRQMQMQGDIAIVARFTTLE